VTKPARREWAETAGVSLPARRADRSTMSVTARALSLDPPIAGVWGSSRIRVKGLLDWDDVGI
jgi:hypothetical protein